MRLLHITDLHFRTPWFDWLAMEAPRFEACCFSGDFLDFLPTAPVSLRKQSRWMRSWLKAFPGRMYACTGNHDWWMPQEYVTDNDARGGWLRTSDAVTQNPKQVWAS
jgi:3',5'-cyclic AMP phosphodiesterase CpdA